MSDMWTKKVLEDFLLRVSQSGLIGGCDKERGPNDILHKGSFKFGHDFIISWEYWGPPVDPTIEIEKREKELAQVVKRITSKEKKLSNGAFVSRAPAEVVQRERDSLVELKDRHMALAGE